MYYDLDDNLWSLTFDEPGYYQSRCYPPNSPVIMNKVRTTLAMPVEIALKCGCNWETRKQWDNVLDDLRQFEMKADLSYGRVAYNFKSPFPVSDRDFYV